MVGALITKDGDVVGRGYHRRFGGNHAEINAIENAGDDLRGATLYVTLEPCCHTGKKTPPCLDTLLRHDWRRVVVGTLDPNPAVNGRSVGALKQRGIDTRVGVLEKECQKLNEVYFKYIQTEMPFVTVKFAQTIDGRIASATGDSRWISSEPSLRLAHRLRSRHDAVLVGVGTILADDPQLTVRLVRGRNPLRVVVDSRLSIPLYAGVLTGRDDAGTIVATTGQADAERLSSLKRSGVQVLMANADVEGRVDLKDLMAKLGRMNISSVLVEGGATVITSLMRHGMADKVVAIVAPKIMGSGIEAVGDLGVQTVDSAMKLSLERAYRSGDDLVIEAVSRS
jgi:diaminohydroxyphosphoribosylaminopyrimidine deaminase/5-amino-6-(5-phosphoribosylamino)uracil reductase